MSSASASSTPPTSPPVEDNSPLLSAHATPSRIHAPPAKTKTVAAQSFDNLLDSIGIGAFHYRTLAILGAGNAADAVEILSIGYALDDMPNLSKSERGLLTAAVFAGMLVGGCLIGLLSDKFGRKNALVGALLLNGVAALASAFAPSTGVLVGVRVIAGLGVGGSVPCVFTMMAEVTPAKHRGVFLNLVACNWMVGSCFTAGAAWLLLGSLGLSWRVLLAVASAPALLTAAAAAALLPESPRWHYAAGRQTKALQILKYMARANGRPLPDGTAASLRRSRAASRASAAVVAAALAADIDGHRTASVGEAPTNGLGFRPRVSSGYVGATAVERHGSISAEPETEAEQESLMSVLAVLFSPRLVRTTVLMIVVWFSLSFSSYGLLVWLSSIFASIGFSVDRYQDAFMVAAANLPGNVGAILLVDVIGRKRLMSGSMLLACGCAVGFALVRVAPVTVAFACAFNAFSTAGWNAVDCLSAEALPTRVRTAGMGLLSGSGRLGSLTAQFVNAHLIDSSVAVVLLVTASFMLLGALAGACLPHETASEALADDVDDGEAEEPLVAPVGEA